MQDPRESNVAGVLEVAAVARARPCSASPRIRTSDWTPTPELPFTRFQRADGTGGAVGIDCAHNAAMMPGAAGGAPADLLEVVTSPTGMGTGNNGLPVLLPAAAFELTPAMLMAEA